MAEGPMLSNLLPQSSVVLHEMIGEGGYSKVWRATYKNMLGEQIEVAAKKVMSCSIEDKEINNMQKMNHENIVKFYGVWKGEDENVYIIMELAKNGDLRKFLAKCKKEHTRPTMKCVLKWTYQAACALQYLKRLNFSHRDIKSLNFLITEDYMLKLGDLGLATQLYETRHTQRRGTTPWMAPEVYIEALRSPKSDIFSFAMVMWEIITADIPYAECKGDFEVMQAVCTGERPVIPDYCPQILKPILISCWDKDREKRPDIDEVCHTLFHYQCTVTDHVESVISPSDTGISTQDAEPGMPTQETASAASTSKESKPATIKQHLLGLPVAKVYKMKNHPHGLCVIINNMDFSEARAKVHKDFKDREGSKVDADNLEKLFTSLHYIVESNEDLTAKEMYDLLQAKRNTDHSQYDCFVCCILTHGRNNFVFGRDGKKLSILELTGFFKATICESLANKPKLFIFEACQGDAVQEAVEIQHDGITKTESIPDEDDFVLGYATVPRHVAYRHPTEGSWYINALVDTIKKAYKDHDLLHLLSIVNDRMKKFDNKGLKQTSSVFSTLSKLLYLNSHREGGAPGAHVKQFKTY